MGAKTHINKLKEFETPFYFYDMELLDQTLREVVAEAARYDYKVHYALKANFNPRILRAIQKIGLGADCVSGNEVRAAIDCGFDPADIVFAGVGKSDKEISYSLENDIFTFNCESLQELEVINDIAARMGKRARIAFRLNPDVSPQTHAHISTGHADSKFGISYTEIDQAIASLDSLKNIEIVGIHFHIGSQICSMDIFSDLCKKVNILQDWFAERGVELKHINLGGGLGIDYDAPDANPIADFASYFAIFYHHLKVRPGQTVHFELGRSIVAQCGELITKALYNKINATGRNIVIVDASMTQLIRPALYQAVHKIDNLASAALKTGKTEVYTVGGTACESSDIFARDINLPVTSRGDILAIRSAGAYGEAMASRYNLHDLPEAVYSDKL